MNRTQDTPLVFAVEVEEYYQDRAFKALIPPTEWSALPARVHYAVDRLMKILESYEVRATFFVDEWIAHRNPEIVDWLAAEGYEIATRGRTAAPGRDGWLEEGDLGEAIEAAIEGRLLLEELTGSPVVGHRAASTISGGSTLLGNELSRRGFRYDSSYETREVSETAAVARQGEGRIGSAEGTFIEVPKASTNVVGLRVGSLGEANFRQLPYFLTRQTIVNSSLEPVVFTLRSWEIDRHHPDLSLGGWAQFRHYAGLEKTESRLERLLSEFRFTSVREYLDLGGRQTSQCLRESSRHGTG